MTSRDFCYWLQGYMEVTAAQTGGRIMPAQVEVIKAHLALVFKHEIDPAFGDDQKQQELNAIHGGQPVARC